MNVRKVLDRVRDCRLCAHQLPLNPRPVLQFHPDARILVAGQAPGRRAHESGVPFSDPSGKRLREWLGLEPETFYDARRVAILPMGFCYPGVGPSGDLPPRPECAPAWRAELLAMLGNVRLTVVTGRHAHAYHLRSGTADVTTMVRAWRSWAPRLYPLPHPSPRNNGWLCRNPWFAAELLPALRKDVVKAVGEPG
ncbi:MAG: uracil-DNA glycosylase family protein [Gammaproteobacteria bacterium]|nr:uracil-DNA glycosylase family protein [Gammaproteobacteria bacterium]